MTVYCSGGYMEGSDVVAVVVMVGKFSEVATEMLVGIKNT
jgi:glutamate synthase domain-containing protein 2